MSKVTVFLGGVCVALTLAGCGDKAQVEGVAQHTTKPFFSARQVRMAFLTHGIRLSPSQPHYPGALTYDSTYAGPYVEVSLFRDSVPNAGVDSVFIESGKPEPVLKWAERRNVWVRYDRKRAVSRRKIMAALNSLSRT